MVNITDLDVSNNSQLFYESFNSFIISDDKKVFNKLVARTLLYNEVKNIPGDIVECGVFKGTGIYTFLKLKNLFNPNSSKKIVGFDFFNTEELIESIENSFDKGSMNTLFEKRDFLHKDEFRKDFENKLFSNGFDKNEFLLVAGDVSTTTKDFVDSNPGFKISLLYMDLDLEKPTYDSLVNLWDRVSKGGLVVFDEYGYHKWSESKGVDRFLQEMNLEIKSLNYLCPTAYIKK